MEPAWFVVGTFDLTVIYGLTLAYLATRYFLEPQSLYLSRRGAQGSHSQTEGDRVAANTNPGVWPYIRSLLLLLLTSLIVTLPFFSLGWLFLLVGIAAVHLILDWMARAGQGRWKMFWFKGATWEPTLHILLILVGWAIAKSFGLLGEWDLVPRMAPETVNSVLIFLAGYLFIFRGGTEIVRDHLERLASLRRIRGREPQVGRIVGNFERFLIVTLVLLDQYTAIGFVLTAKSVARFKQIEEDRAFAEYYLVGTLTSSTIALVVGLLIKWLPLRGLEVPLVGGVGG